MPRQYELIAVNERTGRITVLTSASLTHSEACTMKSRFSLHPMRRIQLRELPFVMDGYERAITGIDARALGKLIAGLKETTK